MSQFRKRRFYPFSESAEARLNCLPVPIALSLQKNGRMLHQQSVAATWKQLANALSGKGVAAFGDLISHRLTSCEGNWFWSASNSALAARDAGRISCITYDMGSSSNALLRTIDEVTGELEIRAWLIHTLPSHSLSRADIRIVIPLYDPIPFREALALQHLFIPQLGPKRALKHVYESLDEAPPNRWMPLPSPGKRDGSWALQNSGMPIFADMLLERSRSWSQLADRRLSELDLYCPAEARKA